MTHCPHDCPQHPHVFQQVNWEKKDAVSKKKSFAWQEAHIFRKNSSYLKTEWNLNLMISLILRDIMFFFRGLCDLVEGRFTTRAWVHLRTGCLEAGGPKYLIWTRMMLLPFGLACRGGVWPVHTCGEEKQAGRLTRKQRRPHTMLKLRDWGKTYEI